MATPQYLPIATAVPIFASVESVHTPETWGSAIPADIWGVIQASSTFTIRQHVKILPKSCCSCPPCVKQENTYSIYAGLSQDSTAEVLRVDEVSDDWNRCCCTPYHPLKLEVRQFIPMPGEGVQSDFNHIASDLRDNFANMGRNDKSKRLAEMYRSNPVLMTVQRHDGMRCCAKYPCKWLSTFVCCGMCQDGADVFAGEINDDPKGEKGRPFENDPSRLIGQVIQPNFGGWCTPTLNLKTPENPDDFAKVEGPCFFGGWSECCCNFKFAVSSPNEKSRAGDLGVIIKQKPASLSGAFRELFSDADVYSIQFQDTAKLSASQKATVLAAQLLADYMWFDGNTEKCKDTDDAVYCYCCYFSCIGAICPVYICIPKNKN